MDKYIFSNEEINKILLSSPMALPDSPVSYGLKGGNIKSFFYDFITRLMLLINEHFVLIEKDKVASILEHNESDVSHSDIREILSDLISKDTELGNAIANHYSEIYLAHDDIRAKIESDISLHNSNTEAHSNLKLDIASARECAENAYLLASGKSKIIPVKDVSEMLNLLGSSLNIGDKFVLSDTNVPDFTLFEKESENSEANSFSMTDLLNGDVEFTPGESYLYEGYLLVASESGIDTSKLAKQSDLTSLEEALNQLDLELDTAIASLIEKLELKEDTIKTVSETAETIILENKTEYNLGLRTSVILELTEEIADNFECIVNFRSGTTATVFNAPGDIVFTQDDCWQGILTPISNRIYEISIKSVDGVLIGKVGRCDCEA